MRGGWSFRRRGVLCLAGRSEATEHSSHWNWIIKKVEAVRSERDDAKAKNGSNKGL